MRDDKTQCVVGLTSQTVTEHGDEQPTTEQENRTYFHGRVFSYYLGLIARFSGVGPRQAGTRKSAATANQRSLNPKEYRYPSTESKESKLYLIQTSAWVLRR